MYEQLLSLAFLGLTLFEMTTDVFAPGPFPYPSKRLDEDTKST